VEGNCNLTITASTGECLTYLANNKNEFNKVLNGAKNSFNEAVKDIKAIEPVNPREGVLYQFWSDARKDNVLCGTIACINSQGGYKFMRIEGYQPDSTFDRDLAPLYDYWNSEITDNDATTDRVIPKGYVNASFSNGYVFKRYYPETVPLRLYWNEERKDMLTVASEEGIEYAINNDYELINGQIGFVYTSPPDNHLKSIKYNRWLYSMELLLNALN